MAEEWRPVPCWPYEASDRGRVRSLARGVPLKLQRDKDGYRYVELSDGPRRWRAHAGRLVLLAWEGEPPTPEHEACHRDGRRWRNWRPNLYWGTREENAADRERHRERRAARRAGRAGVTEVREEKQFEIEETAGVPLETGTGVSPCC